MPPSFIACGAADAARCAYPLCVRPAGACARVRPSDALAMHPGACTRVHTSRRRASVTASTRLPNKLVCTGQHPSTSPELGPFCPIFKIAESQTRNRRSEDG